MGVVTALIVVVLSITLPLIKTSSKLSEIHMTSSTINPSPPKEREHSTQRNPLKLFNVDLNSDNNFKKLMTNMYRDEVEIDTKQWSELAFQVWGNNENWKKVLCNNHQMEQFIETCRVMLSEYDGFVVTHSPLFVKIFEKLGKPIVIFDSCQWNETFCWIEDDEERRILRMDLGNTVRSLFKQGKLRYSLNHLEKDNIFNVDRFVGEQKKHVHTKNISVYGKTRKEIQTTNYHMASMSSYAYADIAFNHIVCVCFPPDISTVTMFELYTMGIPVLLPSKKFFLSKSEKNNINVTTIDTTSYKFLPAVTFFDSIAHLNKILENLTEWTSVQNQKNAKSQYDAIGKWLIEN